MVVHLWSASSNPQNSSVFKLQFVSTIETKINRIENLCLSIQMSYFLRHNRNRYDLIMHVYRDDKLSSSHHFLNRQLILLLIILLVTNLYPLYSDKFIRHWLNSSRKQRPEILSLQLFFILNQSRQQTTKFQTVKGNHKLVTKLQHCELC